MPGLFFFAELGTLGPVSGRSRNPSILTASPSLPMPRFFHLILPFFAALFSVAKAAETPLPARPWEKDAFRPVTAERIATLPAAEQPAWRAYWAASSSHARPAAKPTDPVENRDKPLVNSAPIPAVYSTRLRLDAPAGWYASAEARTLADGIVAWQRPSGGWTKGGDYTRAPRADDDHHDGWSAGTFDNDSTIHELRFLALAIQAADGEPRAAAWGASFLLGLDYLFAAQYPNGGFPQIYPLAGGYHDAITYNDDAVVNILSLLRDVAERNPAYAFVPARHATQARERLDRGIGCILATQQRGADGRLTVWGQQHDALTLQPCAARNFEPRSECSSESANLVLFLMSVPRPSPAIIAAVEGAMAWFPQRALQGVVWDRQATTGSGLVEQAGAPPLWARFYELGTGRPIFGERDRTVHYVVTELSGERRLGYGWYNSRAAALPAAYAAWKAKWAAK
jgi:PelA/Pel-15E family pectate lyase